MRVGQFEAAKHLDEYVKAASAEEGAELDMAASIAVKGMRAFDDLLNGGICNLSKHTSFTATLLKDLSFSPGENTEFLSEGDLKGTPLRTLPARVKPCIRLGDNFYTTDGQFVRDVAYRTIQRGLLRRDPSYRQSWNERQKEVIEQAFLKVLSKQLRGARLFRSVFYKSPVSGDWMETDLVVALDDVLMVIEAKAGAMAMHSPATDFDRFMDNVGRLIVEAHKQCSRFLEYLGSSSRVPVYELRRGEHQKKGELRLSDYRRVIPIGLTIEALTPFSSGCQHLSEIVPILGKHTFMSMSVDDLFVINRFLPTAGELIHYLEVRQRACEVPDATLPDEFEMLGAYIACNRFDIELENQRMAAESVVWNSFANVIEKHFEGDGAGSRPPPGQSYRPELLAIP